LLAVFTGKDQQTLAQVVQTAYKSDFWSLAGQAVDAFGDNCADFLDKAQADCLRDAFLDIVRAQGEVN
jgi:hypothetical protein